MSVLPVSFPSFSFPFIMLLYSVLLFLLKKLRKKSPLCFAHSSQVPTFAPAFGNGAAFCWHDGRLFGPPVPCFFSVLFPDAVRSSKKSRGKVWRICGKVPIFAAAFPSRPGGAFRERLRSLKCWWTKEDTVQEEPFPFGPRPFRKGRNRHFLD